MIAIPNMSKPKSCKECELFYIEFYMGENKMGSACTLNDDDGSTIEADYNSCPLIEIDDELIKKLQESAIVIKTVFNRLKKVVNNSDGLKTELMGTNPNLTIFDECVESVEK